MTSRSVSVSAFVAFLWSTLAVVRAASDHGHGFHIYTSGDLDGIIQPLSGDCKTALTQRIDCHSYVETFGRLRYYGSLDNSTLTSLVCDIRCGESLQSWVNNVEAECGPAATFDDGSLLTLIGGRMLSAYRQTCLKDANSVGIRFISVTTVNPSIKSKMAGTPGGTVCQQDANPE